MTSLRFGWDDKKAALNLRKHGVSFIEASTVFEDENALCMEDLEHSESEERLLILGLSARSRILVVVHCYRKEDEVIRIISARRASARQRQTYERRKE